MHEMPYTQAILDMALKACSGKKITALYLDVGQFSSIVPESVEIFFKFLSESTLAEGTRLVFNTVPVKLACQDCGEEMTLETNSSQPIRQAIAQVFSKGCPCCGQKQLKITQGLRFDLNSIEVAED